MIENLIVSNEVMREHLQRTQREEGANGLIGVLDYICAKIPPTLERIGMDKDRLPDPGWLIHDKYLPDGERGLRCCHIELDMSPDRESAFRWEGAADTVEEAMVLAILEFVEWCRDPENNFRDAWGGD